MPTYDVKTAVREATRFFAEINQEHPPEDVRVEEVELTDDENVWNITLGFYPPGTSMTLAIGGIPVAQRQYRVLRVDANTGQVRSMKIRDPSR
jgi:hypothetical protein